MATMRRPRTVWSADQVAVLMEAFSENPNPKKARKQELGAKLNVEPDLIGTWFQNWTVGDKPPNEVEHAVPSR